MPELPQTYYASPQQIALEQERHSFLNRQVIEQKAAQEVVTGEIVEQEVSETTEETHPAITEIMAIIKTHDLEPGDMIALVQTAYDTIDNV